jgi:DNA repair ATPase RecN
MVAAIRGYRTELKQKRAASYSAWRAAMQDMQDAERKRDWNRQNMERLDAQIEKCEADLAMLGPF